MINLWKSSTRIATMGALFWETKLCDNKKCAYSKLCYQDRHLTSSLIKQYFQPKHFPRKQRPVEPSCVILPSFPRSAEPSCEKPSCLHLPIWLSNEGNAVSWKIMQHSLMLASGNITGPSSSFSLLMKIECFTGGFHLVSTKPVYFVP